MTVVLTHGYFLADDSKEQAIMRPYPPLGILSLSAYLDVRGIDNTVIDTTFSSMPALIGSLRTMQPRYLGIYVNLMTKLTVLKLIQQMRGDAVLQKTVIILGGPDVRYNADEYLHHGADYLVVGEGEETLCELLCALGTGESGSVHRVEGIAFRDAGGAVIRTPERTRLLQINDLPEPARGKIDIHRYLAVWKERHGLNAVSVSTMRGCPYSCKWCSRAVYGTSYRRRSPKLVVDELERITADYAPDTIWFVDDVFTISHAWLEHFAAELRTRHLSVRYECITRADRMNEAVVALLKESGCFRVWIGSESGSQRIIDLMDRRVNVLQVREMIKLTKRYGIEAGTFIMLGYPGETEEDIEDTVVHLTDALPDQCTFTVAYPIKGTPLFYEIEHAQTGTFDFASDTDRDRDFKRTYTSRFYTYAVQRVHNEYHYHKLKAEKRSRTFLAMKFKVRSLLAKTIMQLEKARTT